MRSPFVGLPTFFRALVFEASTRRAGMIAGYTSLGWSFLPHMTSLHDCADDAEESGRVAELTALLEVGDSAAVWAWFAREYPRCAAIIPSRRRNRFVSGMQERFAEEGLFG